MTLTTGYNFAFLPWFGWNPDDAPDYRLIQELNTLKLTEDYIYFFTFYPSLFVQKWWKSTKGFNVEKWQV